MWYCTFALKKAEFLSTLLLFISGDPTQASLFTEHTEKMLIEN